MTIEKLLENFESFVEHSLHFLFEHSTEGLTQEEKWDWGTKLGEKMKEMGEGCVKGIKEEREQAVQEESVGDVTPNPTAIEVCQNNALIKS
jgi:hypothetical protein